MFYAINSTTGERVNSLTVEQNPSYQFIKQEIFYVDTNEIESWDKEKVKDITKVEVRFREGCDDAVNKFGTKYFISPCFFIPNKTELGINLIPESKEHKLVKNWIYNKIKSQDLEFKFSSVKKPLEYDNKIKLSELDIDYSKIGIEVTVKSDKSRRADIIIPFNKYSEHFGCGIVIEIQFSRQKIKTTEERSVDWAFKGYSVCWLWEYDFYEVSDNIIDIINKCIKLDIQPKIIKENIKDSEYSLRWLSQELSRKIDDKMKELNYPFALGECKQCHRGYMTKKKGRNGEFYSCSNWRNGCKHTIPIN